MGKHQMAAEERDQISRIRRRYYDARKMGMDHAAASKHANSGDDIPLDDLRKKADTNARHTQRPVGETQKARGRVRASEPAGEASRTTTEPNTQNVGEGDGAIDIPADWKDLIWPALRSLAAKFAPEGVKIKNRADAEKAINAEIKRRAKSAS